MAMQCISTLHIISTYDTFLSKGSSNSQKNSDTYLNEMCSMITEDFVWTSCKMMTRGVSYNIGNSEVQITPMVVSISAIIIVFQ